jgi:nucleoside-diphosphate-sugar epimerase
MRIFVAGVGGAIGPPLIAAMVRHGHTVTGMSRDEAGMQKLVDMGVTVVIVNGFDGAAVEQALRRSQAAVVIDQLTA